MKLWFDKGLKPILLKNESDIPFITSDRPVINIYGKLVEDIKNFDGPFELYFPISSNFAILWSDRKCYEDINELLLNKTDIYEYNKQMFNNTDNYVFSSKQECFENI